MAVRFLGRVEDGEQEVPVPAIDVTDDVTEIPDSG
jgi:hypothetical protein